MIIHCENCIHFRIIDNPLDFGACAKGVNFINKEYVSKRFGCTFGTSKKKKIILTLEFETDFRDGCPFAGYDCDSSECLIKGLIEDYPTYCWGMKDDSCPIKKQNPESEEKE